MPLSNTSGEPHPKPLEAVDTTERTFLDMELQQPGMYIGSVSTCSDFHKSYDKKPRS